MSIDPHTPYRLVRDPLYGPWKAGDVVYRFDLHTYGVIDHAAELAMSAVDGEYPFYGVEHDNLEPAS